MRISPSALVLTLLLSLGLAGCADANQSADPAPDGSVTCEFPPAGNPARPVDPPSGEAVPATGTVTATDRKSVM